MAKVLSLCLALLMIIPCADAEPPKKWYKDAKVWAVIGLSVGASAFHAHAVNDCRRRAGLEHCYGAYGSRKAMEGLAITMNATGLALSLGARHDDQPKWWSWSTSMSTFWIGQGIVQMRRSCGGIIVNGECVDPADLSAAHSSLMR